MAYLNQAKRIAAEFGVITPAEARPCSDGEVEALEQRLGRRLPGAYREFLLWVGHGAGGFWAGSHAFYADLVSIQRWAAELLRENAFPESLPHDALVFFMHQGYQFMFIRPSEGDDPPVYYYNETRDAQSFVRRASHFSDFLEYALRT